MQYEKKKSGYVRGAFLLIAYTISEQDPKKMESNPTVMA